LEEKKLVFIAQWRKRGNQNCAI